MEKKLLLAAVLVAVGISGLLCLRADEKPKQPNVQWLGNPSYWVEAGVNTPWGEVNVEPRQARSPNVEIGLRDDGVVVWRYKK